MLLGLNVFPSVKRADRQVKQEAKQQQQPGVPTPSSTISDVRAQMDDPDSVLRKKAGPKDVFAVLESEDPKGVVPKTDPTRLIPIMLVSNLKE